MSEQATTGLDQLADLQTEYGPAYYSDYRGAGEAYERSERWLAFFDGVADGIVRDLHPSSVFDAGCAMGFLVEALCKRGVNAFGADISEYAISQVHESVANRCSVATLTEPLPDRYDLVTCIEVLECLPEDEIDLAVANLCQASDQVLFCSAPADLEELPHLNPQAPETWAAKFAEQGFFRDLERDFSYISPWAVLYRRLEEPPSETVRRYDRSWWRLRREASQMREALMRSQDRLAELEGGVAESRPGLLQELDARDEEILRLRDLLIGMEAELGTVRGRVTELEDRTKPLNSAMHRLGKELPFLGKVMRGLLRLFRGQS